MKKLLLLFFLNVAGLKICACDCWIEPKYLEYADVAFRGRVIAINMQNSYPPYEIILEAYKWIKGEVRQDTCKLYQWGMDGCDVPFKVNDSFLVYAKYRPRRIYFNNDTSSAKCLFTDACCGTYNLNYQ